MSRPMVDPSNWYIHQETKRGRALYRQLAETEGRPIVAGILSGPFFRVRMALAYLRGVLSGDIR